LITAAKEMQERLPKDEQYIHASDIEATLQDLLEMAVGKTANSYQTKYNIKQQPNEQ
jgi:hypothetical protein